MIKKITGIKTGHFNYFIAIMYIYFIQIPISTLKAVGIFLGNNAVTTNICINVNHFSIFFININHCYLVFW